MKSTEIIDHGRLGASIGNIGNFLEILDVFIVWQTMQELTYSFVLEHVWPILL